MAIRPDVLPTDPAALTEMVLALDAENEKLRVAMQTLKEMIFGKRSERLATLVAEQLALELDDLETSVTPPAAANDDVPAAKPADKPRKKARRNIGALPKHLPRCEQVLEPEVTACPCCQGPASQDRRGRQRGVGRDPGDPARAAHDPSQIRLPRLH
ncbi:transposase (plasmid) [Bradyrhizobium barranii subsp. barranii]|uniref:Transposase n=1 Tax=Bradyrhizobium barranii subsp. barranii TaxID=2823807 RepID=A0A9X9YDU5_9BRAD|nr:transposase [Bradyrhizobium barranii]UEM18089.1 transposase [Bradyrhizobium barranii subsp. barranii]